MEDLKLNAIKAAYGEHWGRVEYFATENGFVPYRLMEHVEGAEFEFKTLHTFGRPESYVRPIALSGIENNNGWIKLNGEPNEIKISGAIWVEAKNGAIEYFKENEFLPLGYATKYQPAIKPKPSIY